MNTSVESLTHKMQRAAVGKMVDVVLSHADKDRQKTVGQDVYKRQAMQPRNLLRSRAIPMRWSWQAAALHRAAPSSFPATALCAPPIPATCRVA